MVNAHPDVLAKMMQRMDGDIERLILGACTTSTATPSESFTLAKFDEALRKLREPLPERVAYDGPSLFATVPGVYGGMALMNSDVVGDAAEDWSQVRSPARARRRRKKHPQNIKTMYVPSGKVYRVGNTIYGHTLDIARIENQVRRA